MQTVIPSLGVGRFPSPLRMNSVSGDRIGNFVSDDIRIRYQVEEGGLEPASDLRFEKAGPRAQLFFDPGRTRAAIVTCGGLCPGLNTVIRSAFLELHHNYGVRNVLGLRYGYQGLIDGLAEPPITLTPDMVDDIHEHGGTMLGSSRGNQPVPAMVDFLVAHQIDILLTVGGDGTQRGAHEIAVEVSRRGLPIAIVGIPKTIDNDIQYVSRTFGFATAIDKAREVLAAAHAEAKGYRNGVALVRLMGRDSGFIAAGATVASQEVNFTLIPEIPLRLNGERGFLACLRQRIISREHAVVVVAEGAGQDLLQGEVARDASGNVLHKDIGTFLRDRIVADFKEHGIPLSMKYIDPSYIIRAVPANSDDSMLCDAYARQAVHAAMAGKTDLLIGHRGESFMHVPIAMATASRKTVSPESLLWNSVIATTGQPLLFE
ncbi:MAG: ATP-dependent 6-phosphofructokinase [Lentisphaerae bacterium]|nr:ATP-dependent 6-phosphofructokinase [Lentisphaerota bacterium]